MVLLASYFATCILEVAIILFKKQANTLDVVHVLFIYSRAL